MCSFTCLSSGLSCFAGHGSVPPSSGKPSPTPLAALMALAKQMVVTLDSAPPAPLRKLWSLWQEFCGWQKGGSLTRTNHVDMRKLQLGQEESSENLPYEGAVQTWEVMCEARIRTNVHSSCYRPPPANRARLTEDRTGVMLSLVSASWGGGNLEHHCSFRFWRRSYSQEATEAWIAWVWMYGPLRAGYTKLCTNLAGVQSLNLPNGSQEVIAKCRPQCSVIRPKSTSCCCLRRGRALPVQCPKKIGSPGSV